MEECALNIHPRNMPAKSATSVQPYLTKFFKNGHYIRHLRYVCIFEIAIIIFEFNEIDRNVLIWVKVKLCD